VPSPASSASGSSIRGSGDKAAILVFLLILRSDIPNSRSLGSERALQPGLRRMYLLSCRGTTNSSSVRLRVPTANRFDAVVVDRMLQSVRRGELVGFSLSRTRN
jgi:hypothetical protein